MAASRQNNVFGLALVFALFIQQLIIVASDDRCENSCGRYAYCCGSNLCCREGPSYSFYSVWYFWFIVALLIMACAGSCRYCRKRNRMLAVRRQLPLGVVTFSSGNQEHGPIQPMVPPSYQEAISKQATHPPPYYTAGVYSNQQDASPPSYDVSISSHSGQQQQQSRRSPALSTLPQGNTLVQGNH
eukprot:Seg949.1 transcript_id=Seg949.1/GoldUCD/mRNA.D3Y31 product="WW domain-binding protein 1" protein_id=Seg949.1/GoldUCD/D3Y31